MAPCEGLSGSSGASSPLRNVEKRGAGHPTDTTGGSPSEMRGGRPKEGPGDPLVLSRGKALSCPACPVRVPGGVCPEKCAG